MKKTVILALSLMLVGSAGYATGTASGAERAVYLAASVLANAGSIAGVVRCGEETSTEGMGPLVRPWSTVWVQGHSFSARTDENGVFVIDYVPPGTYTLGVQTAGMPIRMEFHEVVVGPRAVTDVGFLDVTGGCGQCGGGGGHDTGGGCEGETDGGCDGETGGSG